MKLENLTYNWFDIVALLMIVTGVLVGRRRGMSTELLDTMQWLLIVLLSALACDPFGRAIADFSGFSPIFCYIAAYLVTAIGVKLVFWLIRKMAGQKLIGSDAFGGFEYYLGMVAGGIRFACMTLFAMAILNARPINEADLAKELKEQNEVLGHIYFPPYGTVQKAVFKGSFTGTLTKEYLASQLITIDPKAGSGFAHNNIGKAREREVFDILDRKK